MKSRLNLKFDELNKLEKSQNQGESRKAKSKSKSIPYREFFGAMYITPEKMHSRIELAEEIEDVMLYIFAYWIIAAEAEISKDEIKRDAKEKLTSVIAKHTKLDPYLEKHIDKVIDEVVDATEKNADRMDKDSYWTSGDRAMLIAENEANSFDNYVDYREAATSGKKVKKWRTENDDKVRLTHDLAEGQTVDIDGLFLVGDSYMRFPMDTMYDPNPREIINCRCTCEYE